MRHLRWACWVRRKKPMRGARRRGQPEPQFLRSRQFSDEGPGGPVGRRRVEARLLDLPRSMVGFQCRHVSEPATDLKRGPANFGPLGVYCGEFVVRKILKNILCEGGAAHSGMRVEMGNRLVPPLFEPVVDLSANAFDVLPAAVHGGEMTSESVYAFSRAVLRRGMSAVLETRGTATGRGATATAGRGSETSAITGNSALSISRSAAALASSPGRW